MLPQRQTPIAFLSAANLKRFPVIVIAVIIAVVLPTMIAFSPSVTIYDEPYYIVGAKMLSKGSTIRDVLLAHNFNLAGPLFPMVQWIASPLTHLDPWRDRWVNVLLLGLSLGAIAYALRGWGYDQTWSRAAMVLAFPPFWVCSGMALTEVPAFACACVSVAAVCWAITAPDDKQARVWLGFVLAGAFFGLAVLGRQPYLPATIGFLCIAVFERRVRYPALAAAVAAILVPLPVFLLWGGLVAPDATKFAGINFDHGMLAYIYLSTAILLIAPRFYGASWRWSIPAAVLAGVCAVAAGGLSITIAGSLARHLPANAAVAFQLVASAVMAGTGAATIVAALFNIWDRRAHRLFVLATLLALGLTSTSLAIGHQFSSRYLMTAFPFALFAVQPYFTPSRWAAVRLLAGSAIGAFALHAYYVVGLPTA